MAIAYAIAAGILWSFVGIPSTHDAPLIGLFLVASVVASRFPIQVSRMYFSGEAVPIVAAAVIAPQAAPIVALSVFLGTYRTVSIRIANGTTMVAAAAAGSLLVERIHPASLTAANATWLSMLAGLTVLLVNALGIAALAHVDGKMPWREALAMTLASVVATTIFNFPIVAALGVAHADFGFWVLPLLLGPLLLVQYFHGLYHKKVKLTQDLVESAEVLARANLQFAAAMVRALDARDAYTAGHSAAVAVYCRDIAREAGHDDATARLAHLAGLLHDIGKIGVPGRVLNKTAKLDDDEFELMKTHAAIGADILGEVDSYAEISVLVRHHHERIDGRGYPDGIGGEHIPAISRMISVADTYSAMTTDRPYREGMPTAKAMAILREAAGTQLDDLYTACFLRVLDRENEAYQRGKSTDFEVEVAKHQAMSAVERRVIEHVELAPDEIEREAA